MIKFPASSFFAFLIDYILYSLLLLFTSNLWLSNVGARIVSATINFIINRKFVFRSKDNLAKSAAQFFLLAALILFGNTIVLGLLVNRVGIHGLAAKIPTEMLFFLVNWSVQNFVIFRKK